MLVFRGSRLPARAIWPRQQARCIRGCNIAVNMSSAERSSLSQDKGLPLPISQPTGNMWAKGRRLRKSTEEETNCDASKDTCSVRPKIPSHPVTMHERPIPCTQVPRIVMKYDSRCAACLGSGWVKTRRFSTSRFRKGRGVLGKCMLCGGGGFVRICTMRIEPDFSKGDSVPANE